MQRRQRDVEQVEQYFRSSIDEIRTQQLRLGRALLRAGADLTQITSTYDAKVQKVAKTYIGGGTPCW
jgi:phosphoserine phosphatase